MADYARQNPGCRMAFIGPTIADVRDTMIEGESGILSILPPTAWVGGSVEKAWNRSMMELRFANGSQIKGFAAETPERLRGPQHDRIWADELGAWRRAEATWDMAMFGLRLGARPQVIVTSTPRPVPLVRRLVAADSTHLSRATTFDNVANLAPTFAEQIIARYQGTRLGRQELYAELLEDVEGALWARHMFDREGFYGPQDNLRRTVVAVDPSGTATGDACGIVVAACYGPSHAPLMHVLADYTVQASPERWGTAVVMAYNEWSADRVVVEKNFGGDMAETVLRQIDRSLPVTSVTASRGKRVRAEPVAALFEQHRATFAHPFPELEDEMVSTTFAPGEASPNRLDALVWAATDLILNDSGPAYTATASARQLVKTRISRYDT